MGYRTLTVDDKKYEYVIGRSCTKIRGGAIMANSQVGIPFGTDRFMVTPGTLAQYLRHGSVQTSGPCIGFHRCGKIVHGLRVLPYPDEILGKKHFCFLCDDCYDRNADDI